MKRYRVIMNGLQGYKEFSDKHKLFRHYLEVGLTKADIKDLNVIDTWRKRKK